VGFRRSLLVPRTGCVCEQTRGHPQLLGCPYLSRNGFLSLSSCCRLFPFLAKYLRPAQGKSSGFRRPVSHRQECLGTRGFPLGKQMFLQQLKFCKELPPARRGRSRRGERCDQQCLSAPTVLPRFGSDLGLRLQILLCRVVTRLRADPGRREVNA